jgi:hypothetical protein
MASIFAGIGFLRHITIGAQDGLKRKSRLLLAASFEE